VARPRNFDEAIVLDAAVGCFWQHGYGATTVRDLADRMGIPGPSLYNAFGDKRTLFRRALERYLDGTMRTRIARLEATLPPRDAVRSFIEEIIEGSLGDCEHRGCFLVNSALEVAPHDAELGADIAVWLDELEGFFHRSITAAQDDGTVPPQRDARDMARLLMGIVLGIRVLARAKPDRSLLESVARTALALLDFPNSTEPYSTRKGTKR
jgi:TetR/AcrR family transcriptional regulator, transcriptional repressor for nem operon